MIPSLHSVKSSSYFGFVPTLLSNLLPVGGIVWLGWQVSDLFAVYWVEIWVLLFVYGIAALFAQKPLVAKDRTLALPGVSRQKGRNESRWGGEAKRISVTESLPPIYPRNFRLVRMTIIWGVGFLLLPLLRFTSAITSSLSLPLLGTAVAMALSHSVKIRREYFAQEKYKTMSAHMVLEIPGRLIIFWTIYVAALLVIGGGILVGVGAIAYETGFDFPNSTPIVVFQAAIVFGKIGIEWSKYRAENESEPEGFSTWFLPENPHKIEVETSNKRS